MYVTLRHKQHNDLPWKLFIPQRKLKKCSMIINYNWLVHNISPKTKLQATSESQESKYSTTSYSSPASLQKFTS